MALEDKIDALVTSIDLLTDSNQHLAATLRQLFSAPELSKALGGLGALAPLGQRHLEPKPDPKPETKAETASTETVKTSADTGTGKPRGRPPKNPPPASPIEQAASVSSSTTTTAPAATGTYADLQRLVPKLAADKGRSAVIEVFAQVGVSNGKELQEKFPEKIPQAVAMFKQAVGEE